MQQLLLFYNKKLLKSNSLLVIKGSLFKKSSFFVM